MRRLIPAAVLPLILAFSSTTFAFTAEHSAPGELSRQIAAPMPIMQRIIRPDLSNAVMNSGEINTPYAATISHDMLSGAPRLITIIGEKTVVIKMSEDHKSSLISQARQFIAANENALGVKPENIDLVENAVLIADDLQSLKFNIKDDGVLVDDASMIFRFKGGRLVQVMNESFAEATPSEKGVYDLDQLEKFAASVMLADSIVRTRDVIRVQQHNGFYEKITAVEFEVTVAGVPYFIQINSRSGEVFEIRAKYHMGQSTAKATVFPRWYNETIGWQPLKELQITNGVYTDDAGFFSGMPGLEVSLTGTRVKVNDKNKKPIVLKQVARTDGNFDLVFEKERPTAGPIDNHDDRLTSQAMIYYHITEMTKLAEQYIPQTKWLKSRLTANANVSGSCNAFWDGNSVNFYVGSKECANTGLLADVVYHEWGHGLDANTGGINDSAFSEGFGDIIALLITRSPEVGKGFFYPSFKPVRHLATKVTTKGAGWASDPHAEGLIIGSAFWSLYEYLVDKHGEVKGLDILRNYAFKMIYTADKYTQVYDALLVLDDNDGDLGNGTPNQCLLNKVFAERNLTQPLPSCT